MGKQETVSEIQRDTIRMISALHDRMEEGHKALHDHVANLEQRADERHTTLMEYIAREARLSDARHAEIMARLNGTSKGGTP